MKQIRRVLTLGTLLAVVLSACASLASCQNATPPAETESEFYTTEAATDPATEPETEPETEPAEEPRSLEYKLLPDGSYKIVGIGNRTEPKLVIPSEHEGKPVSAIDSDAFCEATHLTSVTLPNLKLDRCREIFRNCTSLTEILVDEENPYYTSFDGALYNKEMTELQYCPVGKSTMIFPDGVTAIGEGAFSHNVGLTSLVIPEGVTSIGGMAFAFAGMTSIVIPDTVTSLGGMAFMNCRNLTAIRIPNGVTVFDCSMFE
jgi:hypothetical protein